MRTRSEGDAEIQLFDGEILVRSESIRVRSPAAVELALEYPDEVPRFAADPQKLPKLLWLGQAPATVRFLDESGAPMVAADRISSSTGILTEGLAPDRFCVSDSVEKRHLCRAHDQLDAGDRVVVAGGYAARTSLTLAVDLGERRVLSLKGSFAYQHPEEISELEVLVHDEPDRNGTERNGGRRLRQDGERTRGTGHGALSCDHRKRQHARCRSE